MLKFIIYINKCCIFVTTKKQVMQNYDNAHLGVENSQHPANEIETEISQFTIDEDWYIELIENRSTLKSIKNVFKEWYKLNSFPLEKTSDEKQRLAKLEYELLKLMK